MVVDVGFDAELFQIAKERARHIGEDLVAGHAVKDMEHAVVAADNDPVDTQGGVAVVIGLGVDEIAELVGPVSEIAHPGGVVLPFVGAVTAEIIKNILIVVEQRLHAAVQRGPAER